jgi:eukaryotic translation initiation factor 2C
MVCFFAVPPAYYAHLAAFRARFYTEAADRGDGGGSMVSAQAQQPRSTRAALPGGSVRPLPMLKDSVKKVMFYC